VVQSDENSVEMDFLGQNLTFGVDYRFPDNTVLGVALGAGQNNMDGQDKSESITNQIVTSFYLARPFGDIWSVNLSGGLITSQIENRRPDEVSGDVMAGERDGSSHFTNIEVVRNTKVAYGKLDLTAGFTAMRTKLDAYNETGNQPLAFRAQTLDNESLSLGGTLAFDDNSQARRESEAVLQYKLTASLQYDLSEASTARVNFVNVPAETDYVVLNQNDEPLTITIGGGMDWSNAQGTSLTLDYNYQQNATLSKIHSFSATYRKMF
ncbi:MAG: autotransporter outer membrane beta-barrel domain-containing protein, partial [Parvibaculales bacterium]